MQGAWTIDLAAKRAVKLAQDGSQIIATDWYDHRFGGGFSLTTFTGWGIEDEVRLQLLYEAETAIATAKKSNIVGSGRP